ncbi:hypothetical protein OG455_37340 [Kitasatospora sp. NBC_01287]|uniref:hypothetical protein n=1 Tax=Kitasatospora sp. NBC_01287 TaxID=2903573 RepID=UPI002254007F|nr:hypothetical protein [Kitasatospora sp. NBC_01287]MCX4751106.1 hypothetical protein [Kitasatospora sp. NBC_01287]
MTLPRRRAAALGSTTPAVAALAVAVLAVAALTGCATHRASDPAGQATAQGVTVTVTLLPGSGSDRRLQATFSPQRPGFHLYSIDLPAQGIDGLGIPTRLSVQGGLTATGTPTANLATRLLRPAHLSTELPVYPDGPVTFVLPVRRTGAHQADVTVSYGACSESTCLMPVSKEVIPLGLN